MIGPDPVGGEHDSQGGMPENVKSGVFEQRQHIHGERGRSFVGKNER